MESEPVFRFLNYSIDQHKYTATFTYQGSDGIIFTEKVQFARPSAPNTPPPNTELLNRAGFLAFIFIGTSYYKAHPASKVQLEIPIDTWQAQFFNQVYQEGLSQYAFENHLTRAQLAHFQPTANYQAPDPIAYSGDGTLSLQSGGKDSLLTATLLNQKGINYLPWYVSSTGEYPEVLDHLRPGKHPLIATRLLDLDHLQQSGGYNGHVPVTYILSSLALIQALFLNQNIILTSIGQEGNEPHAMLGDLPVNHQWSKTWDAEQLLAEYIKRYISPDLHLGSPLRHLSELAIAELFVKHCWKQFGTSFSSCNVANYRQKTSNQNLYWCGRCPKCTNAYLLFSPFLDPAELKPLFNSTDLFTVAELAPTFQGLLGIDGAMKPFECVGTTDELRVAYHKRRPGYGALPFTVPDNNFNYRTTYPRQKFISELLNL